MSQNPVLDWLKSGLPGQSRSGNVMSVTSPITSVKVISLAFLTDHHLMLDNNSDWKNTGNLFSKPEWPYGKASSPISHTKNQNVGVEVEFEVNPPNASAVIAEVTGAAQLTDSGGGTQSLQFSTKWAITGGNKKVKLQSVGPLPDTVTKLTGDIRWSIKTTQTFDAGASWGHTIYVTMDIPQKASGLEDGITQYRMEKSVSLIQKTGKATAPWNQAPDAIVLALMGSIPGYTLLPDPAVNNARPGVDHPQYKNNFGGAWNIADFISNSAECQAIVRFVRAVIKQIGCPGVAQIMMVYNDPTVNNGNTTLEDDYENPSQTEANGDPLLGLWHTPFQTVNGRKSEALLLAGSPSLVVGTVFDRNNKGRLPGLSPNFFEACLKFTDPAGTTQYFPGGVGGAVYPTKEAVMNAPTFSALVWMSEPGGGQPGEELLKLEKVVKRW
jgi:hypothetical protein